MSSPVPDLQIQPNSGLTIPWAEFISRAGSTSDASFGADGTVLGMNILVYWTDIETAIQQLLGYSYRDTSAGAGNTVLRRILPFQHPLWNQLWCTRIAKIHNVQFTGKEVGLVSEVTGVSSDSVSTYTLALLTLQFTRPEYPVLTDSQITGENGQQQEWLRYVDRLWMPSVQVISQEGNQFTFRDGTPAGRKFQGSAGIAIGQVSLTRRWHQLPEQAVYNSDGFPQNLFVDSTSGNVILGSVNRYDSSAFSDGSFFGCAAGTLRYDAPEIIPRPLQIPPVLMGLVGETFQLQYDVVFHFTFFRGRRKSTAINLQGHNCFGWAGDQFWYPAAVTIGGDTALAISNATNASPIVITQASHPYSDGDIVQIASVTGNTAANGTWVILYIDANSYSLDGSAGNSAYTGGGTAIGGAPAFRSLYFSDLFKVL